MSTHHTSTPQPQPQESTYQTIQKTLINSAHEFHIPATSARRLILAPTREPTIASLALHPTIEMTLHLLNRDLFSAHFLARHAEGPPKWESMYLHGILHRMEGDVENARAWYRDVEGKECLRAVWEGEGGGWEGFLGRVERWKDRRGKDEGVDWEKEERELNEISLRELMKMLEFCERKFGIDRYEDATSEYVKKSTTSDKASEMIVGGEGWREF